MLNLPLFTVISVVILSFYLSWVFIIVIEKLPNFIHQIWIKNSYKILQLKESGYIVQLNTKISHKSYLFLTTLILFLFAAFHAASILQLLAYLIFISIILVLIIIDYKTMLLPDELTLPLIWLGLLFNLHGLISGSLEYSVYGAIFGYLILWSVFWVFKLLTHKEGIGYGDFKLLSAILAFLGIQYLVPMLLLSSVLGIVYYIAMTIFNKFSQQPIDFKQNNAIPFGPYLGIAGIILLFWGNIIINILIPS